MGEFYSKRFIKIWPFFAFMSIVELCSSPSLGSLCEAFANMTMTRERRPGSFFEFWFGSLMFNVGTGVLDGPLRLGV